MENRKHQRARPGEAATAPVDRMESATGSAGPVLVKKLSHRRRRRARHGRATWTEGPAKGLAGRDAVATGRERQTGLSGRCRGARVAGLQPCKQPPFWRALQFKVGISPYCRPKQETYYTKQHGGLLTWYHPCSLFVWLWLVINGRKFSAGTIFFSHTNQPAVLLHKPATITNQPTEIG